MRSVLLLSYQIKDKIQLYRVFGFLRSRYSDLHDRQNNGQLIADLISKSETKAAAKHPLTHELGINSPKLKSTRRIKIQYKIHEVRMYFLLEL
jgi:hypothetical protein